MVPVSRDRLWNPQTGACDAVLGGHSGTVGAIATVIPILGNCRSTVDVSMGGEEATFVSGSGDATVRVWGRQITRNVEGEWICLAVLEGHR